MRKRDGERRQARKKERGEREDEVSNKRVKGRGAIRQVRKEREEEETNRKRERRPVRS